MLFASQFLLVLIFAGSGEPRHGDFGSETLKVGDAKREYRLVVPKTVDLANPAPLVVAFHGMLIDSKDVMPQYTKLNETAEKHGFIIAYPDAIGKSWGIAPEKVKNDLAFFDALIRKLAATYKIDQDRVYVVGMSNGGYLGASSGVSARRWWRRWRRIPGRSVCKRCSAFEPPGSSRFLSSTAPGTVYFQ